MRTRTVLLSALLGALGTVAVNAQTNVYSLNAVGYINETIYPGFNIVSCPLIASPDNTLNTLLPPTNAAFKKWQVWTFNPTNPVATQYTEDSGLLNTWGNGGLETISPGKAVWLYNPGSNPSNVIFVGTVPTGPISTPLYATSFNLVGSAVPASGDIVTNPIMNFTNTFKKDQVWTFTPTNPVATQYTEYSKLASAWGPGDPQLPTVGGGFWYYNAQVTNNAWVENFQL